MDPLVSGDVVKCLQCSLEVRLSFSYLEKKSEGLIKLDMETVDLPASSGEEPVIKKRRKYQTTKKQDR